MFGISLCTGGYPLPDPGTMGFHSIEDFQKVGSYLLLGITHYVIKLYKGSGLLVYPKRNEVG